MDNKIFALFAALLLVMTIPAAWADRDGVRIRTGIDSDVEISDDNDDTEIEVETEIETDNGTAKYRLREEYKDGLLRIREEHKDEFLRIRTEFKTRLNDSNMTMQTVVDARKALLADLKERRTILQDDRKAALVEVKAELKADQDRIKELREEYKTERDQFIGARDKLKTECDSGDDSDCRRAKRELNDEAQDFMGNAAEQMLRIIETMKVRIETNENIDNETAADMITQLELRAAAIENAQASIDALGNSTDVNATKTAAAELRTAWQEASVTIRLSEGLLNHARFQELLDQLESMETRLNEARDKLEAEGKDVTELDAALASFSAKIDASTTAYVSARDSYVSAMAEADTQAEANRLLQSTRTQLQDARSDLEDARQDLREVLKEIRTLSADVLRETAAKVKADADANVNIEATASAEVSG